MKYKNLYSRWHRYDMFGFKEIKKFNIGEIPTNDPEFGYTNWVRGNGRQSPEHYKRVSEGLSKKLKGVPKTPEHKHKLSIAKKGIPKPLEHRNNMKLAHKRRREAYLETQKQK